MRHTGTSNTKIHRMIFIILMCTEYRFGCIQRARKPTHIFASFLQNLFYEGLKLAEIFAVLKSSSSSSSSTPASSTNKRLTHTRTAMQWQRWRQDPNNCSLTAWSRRLPKSTRMVSLRNKLDALAHHASGKIQNKFWGRSFYISHFISEWRK